MKSWKWFRVLFNRDFWLPAHVRHGARLAPSHWQSEGGLDSSQNSRIPKNGSPAGLVLIDINRKGKRSNPSNCECDRSFFWQARKSWNWIWWTRKTALRWMCPTEVNFYCIARSSGKFRGIGTFQQAAHLISMARNLRAKWTNAMICAPGNMIDFETFTCALDWQQF